MDRSVDQLGRSHRVTLSLGVAIKSLAYNKAGYDRQTERWQAEEDNQILLQLHIEGGLTPDGYRRAYIELYFRPVDPVRLEKLEATGPDGITIKADDPKTVKPGTASPSSFEIDEGVGPTTDSGSRILIPISLRTRKHRWIRTPSFRLRRTSLN
jgi:hypothetical protein